MKFVLSTEPWIPCERNDGTVVELSTHDALLESPRLRGISDPSPLVVAVVHRHLLAVLHRALDGPRDMTAWSAVARAGAFERPPLEAYLEGVRDRLDLFHPRHPFAQVRGLVELFPTSLDPIDQLGVERSNWGGARSLFQHRPDRFRSSMSPAEAARTLLVHHAFATGGLVRKPNEPTAATASPLVRSGVVLLRRGSLFETLVANLLCYAPEEALPIAGTADDAPSWEQPPLPRELRMAQEPKRMPRGWLDLLTWLSRRIELVTEGERVVSYVRAVGQGLHDQAPQDPMVTYRLDDKRGFVPIGVDPTRAFWRDANALFELEREGKRFVRPAAIAQVGSRAGQRALGGDTAFSIELSGIAAEKSRLDAVRVERVWTRAKYFDDPEIADVVTGALGAAQSAIAALSGALRRYARHVLSEGSRNPEARDISSFVSGLGAEGAAWSALGLEFDVLLRRIEDGRTHALGVFMRAASRIAHVAFDRATATADGTARTLKARAIGKRALELELGSIAKGIPSPTPPEITT